MCPKRAMFFESFCFQLSTLFRTMARYLTSPTRRNLAILKRVTAIPPHFVDVHRLLRCYLLLARGQLNPIRQSDSAQNCSICLSNVELLAKTCCVRRNFRRCEFHVPTADCSGGGTVTEIALGYDLGPHIPVFGGRFPVQREGIELVGEEDFGKSLITRAKSHIRARRQVDP
jgi:hypothetical protein